MNFGKTSNLDKTDFMLPADHKGTQTLLKKLKKDKNANPNIYVGCGKWGREEWIGKIYPEGTRKVKFLNEYVKQFNSIELNATHYKIPDKKTIRDWKSKAPQDFKFCPKFPRSISHIKRLKDAEEPTQTFIKAIQAFEENLGPAFLQLPPDFTPKNVLRLEKYLKSLPENLDVFVELRHPEWFSNTVLANDLFKMFENYNIGTIITDTAGRRDCLHQRLTIPAAFIRFVGNNFHPSDYTRIDDWVLRIKKWLDSGLNTVYFFIHQHKDESDSPELCAYLIKELNKQCNLNLKEPVFIGSKKKTKEIIRRREEVFAALVR